VSSNLTLSAKIKKALIFRAFFILGVRGAWTNSQSSTKSPGAILDDADASARRAAAREGRSNLTLSAKIKKALIFRAFFYFGGAGCVGMACVSVQYRRWPRTGWTPSGTAAQNPVMGRYTFPAFKTSTGPRYVVLWDLHWQLLEIQRLEPAADLSGAIEAAIARLEAEGWQAEATPEYGFTFIQRANERRLLMLTPRDPYIATSQSFSPFHGGN
jgi:hypothetical protein